MKLHSTIRNACLVASLACVLLSYVLAGYWVVVLVAAALPLLWLLMKRKSGFWAASALLLAYLVLCLVGILLECPLVPLVLGCISALAWWDLMDFGQSFRGDRLGHFPALLERHRHQALGLMISVSLALEMAALWLRVRLTFGAILLLVLLALSCIVYTVNQLMHALVPRSRQK